MKITDSPSAVIPSLRAGTIVKPLIVRGAVRNLMIVKVETDEGYHGWGEAGLVGRELAVKGAVKHYRRFLVGKDPRRIGVLWQEMYRSQYFEGGRVLTGTISAIDDFIEITISSRRSMKERKIDALLDELEAVDTLIVSELSRMGRSVGEIITTVDRRVMEKIRFIAVKEGIRLNGSQDIQMKVMVTLFGLFAEIERELISMRTKEGLAAARAKGK